MSTFREHGFPYGLHDSLCTLHLFCSPTLPGSATGATLATGGWLALTRQGLSPCKTHQASLGTLTPGFTGLEGRAQLSLTFSNQFSARPSRSGRQPASCHFWYFSNCPPPNRTCDVHRIRLSSGLRSTPSYGDFSCILVLETLTDSMSLVSGLVRRTLTSLSLFPLSTAFPFAESSWDSVTMSLSACTPSRVPCVVPVR